MIDNLNLSAVIEADGHEKDMTNHCGILPSKLVQLVLPLSVC